MRIGEWFCLSPALFAAGEFARARREHRGGSIFSSTLSPAQRMIERDKRTEKRMMLSLRERDGKEKLSVPAVN
jgi:hypothetical protein